MPDLTIAKNIAFKTDLQDTPPSGFIWQPAIRGFLFEDHFLFIKTFLDTSTDVRKGRVFSHCLIVSKTDLKYISDIEIICSYFIKEIDKTISLEPIALEIKDQKQPLDSKLQPRFNKVIKAFLKLSEYESTIIWSGQDNYENAAKRFWQLLTTAEKENVNFGINFNPNEIPKAKINFVTIPENSEGKFINSAFCLVKRNDSETLTDFSEQFLAGDPSAMKRLEAFTKAIDSRSIQRAEIGIVAKGIKTYENIDIVTDLKLLNTLSNIVAEFSPDFKKGKVFKSKLVERICLIVQSLDAKELPLLKSFKIQSFNNSEAQFTISINKWLDDFLFAESTNKKNDYTSLIVLVYSTPPKDKNWWSTTIKKGIKDFLSKINDAKASIIWSWVSYDASIFKHIGEDIDKSEVAENSFISTLPKKIEKSYLASLKTLSINNNWLRLYAEILQLEFSFEEAIVELLSVDTNDKHFKAIEVLTKKANPQLILSSTLKSKDSRLISISGKLCFDNHELLNKLDTTNSTWLNIWAAAIKNGNKLDAGILKIQEKIHGIFDQIIKGAQVDEILIDKIFNSDYSSILSYSQRAVLWNKIGIKYKPNVVLKTFSNLMDTPAVTTWTTAYNDVKQEVLKQENLSHIFKTANTSHSIWLFKNNTELNESRLIDFLNIRSISLSSADCKELALLINQRKLESTFNLINNRLVTTNSNFNQTIDMCADTFKKAAPFDFFGVLGKTAPKKNLNNQIKTKVLFLSANPNSTTQLRVNAELRKIEESLQAAKKRENFDLISKVAVKFDTFSKAILENTPEIIHFSGHADHQGIALEHEDGELHAVPNEALNGLFKLFKNTTKCVILNACYTENQAKLISNHGIYVIGMNSEIGDEIAILFSIAFYTGIWSGKDSVFSYNFAITHVIAKNKISANVPVLWFNGKKVVADEKKENEKKGSKKS